MPDVKTDVKKRGFGEALEMLKKHPEAFITRVGWYGTVASPKVKIQRPDDNSFMTEPYLYMEKNSTDGEDFVRFPVDLSCESILANDWIIL